MTPRNQAMLDFVRSIEPPDGFVDALAFVRALQAEPAQWDAWAPLVAEMDEDDYDDLWDSACPLRDLLINAASHFGEGNDPRDLAPLVVRYERDPYPDALAWLQPIVERCAAAGPAFGGNDDDYRARLLALGADETQALVKLYQQLVDPELKPVLDDWTEGHASRSRSETTHLLLLLDHLARHGHVPEPHAATRFIEWDTRAFDDQGNEW